jgi:uncharacterized protein
MSTKVNETVLITGASSGIGLELAKCFAEDLSRLVLVARNKAALETLDEELRRAHKIEVIVLVADLSLSETPKRIFQELCAHNISVDMLVNNAGFGAIGAFDQLSLERQLEMLRVNISALTELTWLCLPHMIRQKRGGILNVGSVAGFVPGPGMAVYFATKAYVMSFTEGLAAELEGTGVVVSDLCPGPTATNFGAVAGSDKVKMIKSPRMTAQEVAQYGHRAFRRGKVVAVSGLQNKLLVFLAWLMPRMLVAKISRKFNGFQRLP